jgi:type IV pilus assembly protein PilN
MIRINLLPYRETIKKENIKRQLFVISGVIILFLAIIVAVQLNFMADLQTLEDKVQQHEARLLILNKKVGDVEKFKGERKELEQKLQIIKRLESNRYFPVRLLDTLSLLIPSKHAWLERVTQKGTEIRIEGIARDNGVVAVFMKNLEKTDFVRSVDLVVTKEKEIVGVKLQQFVLTCKVNQ